MARTPRSQEQSPQAGIATAMHQSTAFSVAFGPVFKRSLTPLSHFLVLNSNRLILCRQRVAARKTRAQQINCGAMTLVPQRAASTATVVYVFRLVPGIALTARVAGFAQYRPRIRGTAPEYGPAFGPPDCATSSPGEDTALATRAPRHKSLRHRPGDCRTTIGLLIS